MRMRDQAEAFREALKARNFNMETSFTDVVYELMFQGAPRKSTPNIFLPFNHNVSVKKFIKVVQAEPDKTVRTFMLWAKMRCIEFFVQEDKNSRTRYFTPSNVDDYDRLGDLIQTSDVDYDLLALMDLDAFTWMPDMWEEEHIYLRATVADFVPEGVLTLKVDDICKYLTDAKYPYKVVQWANLIGWDLLADKATVKKYCGRWGQLMLFVERAKDTYGAACKVVEDKVYMGNHVIQAGTKWMGLPNMSSSRELFSCQPMTPLDVSLFIDTLKCGIHKVTYFDQHPRTIEGRVTSLLMDTNKFRPTRRELKLVECLKSHFIANDVDITPYTKDEMVDDSDKS